jgi:hypothetical protein
VPKRIDRSREIARGPLRLLGPTYELPEPPVRTVEEVILRLLERAARVNERER